MKSTKRSKTKVCFGKWSKLKAKRNRDEEKLLTSRFAQLSAKLQTAYSEDDKAELERIKIKLSDFQTEKTLGAIIRSRARWYEHGEKNSKYFLNLEKLNHWRKHISSLINHNGTRSQLLERSELCVVKNSPIFSKAVG